MMLPDMDTRRARQGSAGCNPRPCLSGRRTARQMLGRAWQAGELAVTAALPIDRARVQAPSHLARRGGREVECAALEMRFTGNRNVGSNPTLSANDPAFTSARGARFGPGSCI